MFDNWSLSEVLLFDNLVFENFKMMRAVVLPISHSVLVLQLATPRGQRLFYKIVQTGSPYVVVVKRYIR